MEVQGNCKPTRWNGTWVKEVYRYVYRRGHVVIYRSIIMQSRVAVAT